MDVDVKIVNKERRLFLTAILSSPLIALFSGCDEGGETCKTCNGAGKRGNGVRCTTCSGSGRVSASEPCTLCSGSGKNPFPSPMGLPNHCSKCKGTGKRNP